MVLTGLQDQEGNSTFTELPICWLWAIPSCCALPLVRAAGCSFVALFGPAGAAPGRRGDRFGRRRFSGSSRGLLVFGLHWSFGMLPGYGLHIPLTNNAAWHSGNWESGHCDLGFSLGHDKFQVSTHGALFPFTQSLYCAQLPCTLVPLSFMKRAGLRSGVLSESALVFLFYRRY